MSSLLAFLLSASAVGALTLCIIVAIKPATTKVFSKTWHYYMGLIPAIFFLGGAGLLNMPAEFIQPYIGVNTSAIYANTATGIVNTRITPIIAAETYLHLSLPVEPVTIIQSPQATRWTHSISGFINTPAITHLLVLIWVIGMAIFAIVNIMRYMAYRQALMQYARPYAYAESPITALTSNTATTPLLIGFIRPKIILPDIEYSWQELEMILAHELVHHRRKDTWLKLLILIVNAIHWFNPAAYALTRYMNNHSELSCDEAVVIEMDAQARKSYGETILAMLQHSAAQKSLICASTLCSPSNNIKRRLEEMLNVKKTHKIIVAISLALALIITGVGGVVAYGLRLDASSNGDITITSPTIIPADEVITSNITVESSVLHLYGHVNGIITVNQSGSLIISGSGQVNGTVVVDGYLYLSDSGLITGAGTRGVTVNQDGVFVMNGGYIRGNSYTGVGGGVWLNNGTFIMYDGYIIENISDGGGGGVYMTYPAHFTMHGGRIKNNTGNVQLR